MSLVVFTALVGLMVAPGHLHPVLGFGVVLAIASVTLMWLALNLAAAALLALTICFYVFVYTIWRRVSASPATTGSMGMPARA